MPLIPPLSLSKHLSILSLCIYLVLSHFLGPMPSKLKKKKMRHSLKPWSYQILTLTHVLDYFL